MNRAYKFWVMMRRRQLRVILPGVGVGVGVNEAGQVLGVLAGITKAS